jgi:TPR repeat protein
MERVALIAAVLSVSTSSAHAQPTPPASQLAQETRAAVNAFRKRVAGSVPTREALKINSVDINIVPDFADFSMPIATSGDSGRGVRISLGYIARLRLCIEANMMEATFKANPLTRDLWSAYDIHTNGSIHWENQRLLPLEVFAGLSSSERQVWASPKVRAMVASWFDQAVAFVFAHELGHHALDAFYTVSTPPSATRGIESAADSWAVSALTSTGIVPLAGAFGAIMCLKGRAWYTYVPAAQSSHPGQAERVLQALSQHKTAWRALYANPPYSSQPLGYHLSQEQGLESALQKMVAEERAETAASLAATINSKPAGIEERAARIDAMLKLARHHLHGWDVPKDLSKRHELLQMAADEGDPWAQYAVGATHDTGASGVAVDRAKAYFVYTWLAAAGDTAAKASLGGLPKRAAPQEICEGACRVGASTASFQSCFERKRNGCVADCTSNYGWERELCEERMCGISRNYVHWYPACLPASLPSAQQCSQQCQPRARTPTSP